MESPLTSDSALLVSLALIASMGLLMVLRRHADRARWDQAGFTGRFNPLVGACLFGFTHPSSAVDALSEPGGALYSAVLLMHIAAWIGVAVTLFACLRLARDLIARNS